MTIPLFPPFLSKRWSSFLFLFLSFCFLLLPSLSTTLLPLGPTRVKNLLPSHFIKFMLYLSTRCQSLVTYIERDLARTMKLRLHVWKKAVLHIRDHQREGNLATLCMSLRKAVNQPIFAEDLLCPLYRVASVRESWFFPRNRYSFRET